jgi:hypothetical protein
MEEQVRGLFFTGNYAKAASMAKSPVPDILIWQMRAALESKQVPVQSIPAVASFPAANFQALCDFLRGRAASAEVSPDSMGFAEVVKAYEVEFSSGNLGSEYCGKTSTRYSCVAEDE